MAPDLKPWLLPPAEEGRMEPSSAMDSVGIAFLQRSTWYAHEKREEEDLLLPWIW